MEHANGRDPGEKSWNRRLSLRLFPDQFNIVTKSLTLQNFTKEEITQLYRQHTAESGQVFEDAAIELVWEQTQGQPWLVNAVAREVIVEILQSDYTKPVTADLVSDAIQNIILNRTTHIDSLLERLKEERVRRIIEPMILGEGFMDEESDDFGNQMDVHFRLPAGGYSV